MTRLPLTGSARTVIGAMALFATLLAAVLSFTYPWVNGPWLSTGTRNVYAPLRDGTTALVQRSDRQGGFTAWVSQNVRAVSPLRLFGEYRAAPSGVMTRALGMEGSNPEDTANVAIFEVRERALKADGNVEEERTLLYVNRGNVYLVGPLREESRSDLVFDPPLLQLIAQPKAGSTWASSGRFGSTDYSWTAQVIETGSWAGPSGSYDDCLLMEGRLTLRGGTTTIEHRERDRYCATAGLVESTWYQGDEPVLVSQRHAFDGPLTARPALPPVGATSPQENSGTTAASEWSLMRVGRTRSSVEYSESTIPATYIPSQPPLVLAANQAGDLLAFDADVLPGELRWSYRSAGAIYGPPAFDPERGRIYLGASDKRLHALDQRGLHLWSFRVGDNVATRPVVVGDVVVFGSEDRSIYGVDAETGQQRWKTTVGEAVGSSPARWGDTVVIGADDGVVYALNGRTGERRWSAELAGGIEAAITIEEGVAYVGSRDGVLVALDVDGCHDVCAPLWHWEGGARFRTAATVDGDVVLMVDSNGGLHAFDRWSGVALWADRSTSYTGPLARLGDALIAATYEGRLVSLGIDHEVESVFSLADVRLPVDGPLRISLGPTDGGGAVWLGDAGGALYRLGPPPRRGGPVATPVAWWNRLIDPPFAQRSMSLVLTRANGQPLVVDDGLHLFSVDSGSGISQRLDTASGPGPTAGSALGTGRSEVILVGRSVFALNLEAGGARWTRDTGVIVHPPVAIDEEVLWLSLEPDATLVTSVNRRDGSPRWESRLPRSELAGSVAVLGSTVLVSTPPTGLDRATGQVLWSRQDAGIGGLAADAGAGMAFVGMFNEAGAVDLVALNPATGVERWRTGLSGEALDLTDQPLPAGDLVLAPLASGALQAYDITTGRPRWRFVPPIARYGGVTVDQGRVWMALRDGGILALRLQDGVIIARSGTLQLPLDPSSTRARPVVFGRRVIMPFGSAVIGFDIERLGP